MLTPVISHNTTDVLVERNDDSPRVSAKWPGVAVHLEKDQSRTLTMSLVSFEVSHGNWLSCIICRLRQRVLIIYSCR